MGPSQPSSPWWVRLEVTAGVALTLLVTGVLGAVMFGAFSSMLAPSEEVDWEHETLEVVAEGNQDACMLNVDAVAPGEHKVRVIAVDSPSQVRIEDESGTEVFRAHDVPGKSSEDEPGEGAGPTDSAVTAWVELGVGTYQVVCDIADGGTASVPLRVRPAAELE